MSEYEVRKIKNECLVIQVENSGPSIDTQ